MSETWVLNEALGTTDLTPPAINFTSNSKNFNDMSYNWSEGMAILSYIDRNNRDNDVDVYNTNSFVNWINQAYRTITFETAPSGDLLTWLTANGTKQASSQLSVDITTLPKYSSIPLGTHKLTIVASAPGYLDSDPSQEVAFINGYPITFNVTNCTYSPSATMVAVFEPTTFTFTKSTGYSLPSSISVAGVASGKYAWTVASDGLTATLVITEPTSAVTVTVTAVIESYAVTVNGTHAAKKTGPDTVQYGGTGTFTFEYPSGYSAPDSVTISGAMLDSWNKATSTLTIKNVTGPVTITIEAVAKTYAIRVNGTHASATDGSPTTIKYGGTATLSFDYDRGYFAPATVRVDNADGNWDQDTNELVITNPDDTGDVIVTIEAIEKTYDIKYALTNLTAASSNPTTITSAATGVELTISGSAYYALPTSITVSGVATGDWSYDQAAGKVTLSYPTGTVTITAVGVEISATIDGIWSWKTTIPDGTWTEQAVNFTSNGGSYSGMEWDGYDLYYIVAADGTKQKVYSFNEDTQVGTWADGGDASYWRIVDFGTTEATVSKIFADYVSANAVPSGKLAAPTGVQVADDEASWNEVENATRYDIVVDNASWGTHIPAVYNYTFDEATGVLTLLGAPYEQNGDTVTITDDSTVIVTKAVKGDLITIEDKQYRVLKTEGTVAEVLATRTIASLSTTKNSQVYAGNAFDTYCNETFYNSLSTNMKNAIIEKTFNQDSWYYNEGTSSGSGNPIYRGVYDTTNYWLGLQTMAFGSSIMRKCYLLSIQDIIDYLGVTSDMTVDNTTLTNENLWKMFWNPATNPHAYVRLRSNYVTSSENYAFYINMKQGNLYNGQGHWSGGVVPAFQIDLSKISWSK